MKLGVCYYPEHWDENEWPAHARDMRQLGIKVVRVGEFAWSRLEPEPGRLEFDWLRRVLDGLGDQELEVVLGTPTATPPKWLIDKHPDILATDELGNRRHFGSRRHYCFSSGIYREHCQRIVELLAREFGEHEAVTAWQTDNEYGCHDTILSYSESAAAAFRAWCEAQYDSIDDLNHRWGNVFWSMEYNDFAQIDLPCLTVTEANPAHVMAFWRFSSDQVRSFNQLQTNILRQHSPGRDLIHNYMGNFTSFDHFEVAKDLDVAAWDNYPLGFLDRDGTDPDDLQRWYRTGHPDSSALHHDLYRGVGRGRWWVMEQQPGPVNWAPHNPSPLDGMVRLWGWEAFAHAAEVVSWFRWQQAPFAQEQLHTGLRLPNGELDTGGKEVQILAKELDSLNNKLPANIDLKTENRSSTIAMLFDYKGNAMQQTARFFGDSIGAYAAFTELYTACRCCGVNIDIVSCDADLEGYPVVILQNQVTVDSALLQSLKKVTGTLLLFPGSGSRDQDFTMPTGLAPGKLRDLINLTVTRSETLPPFAMPEAVCEEGTYRAAAWRERINSEIEPQGVFDDGWGFHYRHDNVHYINAKLKAEDLKRFMRLRLQEANVSVRPEHTGLRYRQHGSMVFAFNFGPDTLTIEEQDFVLGAANLKPGELAAWNEQ